ncbi:MAG: hypothetical protein JOZ05_05215 [Acetobacteraceae bacterium]|nr:hypothetical protein [Acetobacteraceae bacterium]
MRGLRNVAESLGIRGRARARRPPPFPNRGRPGKRFPRPWLTVLGLTALLSLAVASHLIVASDASPRSAPATELHYAPNHNFGADGKYLPAQLGFNLADLNTVEQLEALPPGVKGLVWVGQCEGVTPAFLQKVQPFIGHPKLFGFYLMDNPDPRPSVAEPGGEPPCPPQRLRAESDWIHANLPGAKTFMILMNLGTAKEPWFSPQYAPDVIHLDLYGIDPYPCRTELEGCGYDMIDRYVAQAGAAGIPRERMVPVYQVFGNGKYKDDFDGKYILPTAEEERQMMLRWGMLVASPVFDYAYSWGSQEEDDALEGAQKLHPVFAEHNGMERAFKVDFGRQQ